MRRFIEKAIIILFCLFNTYKVNPDLNLVFYFLVSLIISVALDLIPKKQIRFYLYICFLGFIIYDQLFVYYIPLILYNLYLDLKLYSLLALLLLLLDFSIINLIIAGSTLPDLVPMIKPSKGVKPMVVSITFPPSIAAILEPFPKWQVIIFNSDMGFPIISATLWATKRWEVPWKPYLLMPYFS